MGFFSEWKSYNYYPYNDPPEGEACAAINFIRRFVGLPVIDFLSQEMVNGSAENQFSLEDVVRVEKFVDPNSMKFLYSLDEIKAIGDMVPDTLPDLFDHLLRVIHLVDDENNFFYLQPRGEELFFKRQRAIIVSIVMAVLFFLILLSHFGFSFEKFFSEVWLVLSTVVLWCVDVLAPMLFVVSCVIGFVRWIRHR